MPDGRSQTLYKRTGPYKDYSTFLVNRSRNIKETVDELRVIYHITRKAVIDVSYFGYFDCRISRAFDRNPRNIPTYMTQSSSSVSSFQYLVYKNVSNVKTFSCLNNVLLN